MRKLRSRKNLIIEGLNNPYIIESVDKSVNAKLFSFCKRVGLDKTLKMFMSFLRL